MALDEEVLSKRIGLDEYHHIVERALIISCAEKAVAKIESAPRDYEIEKGSTVKELKDNLLEDTSLVEFYGLTEEAIDKAISEQFSKESDEIALAKNYIELNKHNWHLVSDYTRTRKEKAKEIVQQCIIGPIEAIKATGKYREFSEYMEVSDRSAHYSLKNEFVAYSIMDRISSLHNRLMRVPETSIVNNTYLMSIFLPSRLFPGLHSVKMQIKLFIPYNRPDIIIYSSGFNSFNSLNSQLAHKVYYNYKNERILGSKDLVRKIENMIISINPRSEKATDPLNMIFAIPKFVNHLLQEIILDEEIRKEELMEKITKTNGLF
ncbi:hypothetical protein J4468_00415 [Candidatus Woesearchaeota archaeon]|nr:hypothetical protein [Candidatus Woesearchaeota archaeon]